ncbi:MAG: HEAT repeat domain-containing protein [Pseudoxanthomonas sp.]|nr:HEAT repeat domain-containing protein [Pseudoxanthomonas sp.]
MTEKTEKKRPTSKNQHTWQKGKSGNPGGRSPRVGPNGETAAELARMHTAEAIATLKDGMSAPDWYVRVQCANSLLQRGWGTPKAPEDEGSDKPDLAQVLAQLIEKLPG